MNKINEIVNNEIKKYLNESLSRILFHFTNLELGYKIMRDNAYYLPSVYSGHNDKEEFSKKRYYMCFTRNRSNLIGFAIGNNVRFEFNGDMLNQKFSGKSVIYSSGGGPHNVMKQTPISYTQESNETEDRLFSNDPIIKNIRKYVNRVDICIDENNNNQCVFAHKILTETNFKDIVYIYNNNKDFNSRNKNIINNKIYNFNGELNKYEENYNNFTDEKIGQYLLSAIQYICTYDYHGDIKFLNAPKIFKDLLKKHNLNKYIQYIIPNLNNIKNYLRNYDFDLAGYIQIIHKGIKDMNEYVNIIKMFEEIYNILGIHNEDELFQKNMEFLNSESFYEDYKYMGELNKTFYGLKIGKYIFLHPDKLNYWKTISNYTYDQKEKLLSELSDFIDNNNIIQHYRKIFRENLSISDMYEILMKMDLDEETKFSIFWKDYDYYEDNDYNEDDYDDGDYVRININNYKKYMRYRMNINDKEELLKAFNFPKYRQNRIAKSKYKNFEFSGERY